MSQRQQGMKILDVIKKFLYPIGVFRDASKGSFLERAAAYRHNREARGCIPQYMTNWLLVGLLTYGAGIGLENAHNLAAAVLCWLLVTYAITELAVLSAIYLVLSTWDY